MIEVKISEGKMKICCFLSYDTRAVDAQRELWVTLLFVFVFFAGQIAVSCIPSGVGARQLGLSSDVNASRDEVLVRHFSQFCFPSVPGALDYEIYEHNTIKAISNGKRTEAAIPGRSMG